MELVDRLRQQEIPPLTLDNTDMTMDGTGTASNVHAIYFTGNDKLNIQNGSNLTIQNYKQDALEWDGGDGGYNVNITNGSSYTSDHNRSGITGTFVVTVDDSTLNVINSTGNGSNGSHFDIKNDSTVNFSNNGVHGLSAGNLNIEDSTVTANNNGYNGIIFTGKGTIKGFHCYHHRHQGQIVLERRYASVQEQRHHGHREQHRHHQG